MKKRTVALLMACMLLIGCAVTGTVAWLMDTTDTITNTFTSSDITITLTETGSDFKMVPGGKIEKDPIITVREKSEPCWLFVKLERSGDFDSYLTYTMADGWSPVPGAEGVYRYDTVVNASSAAQTVQVLKDNEVTVKTTVTKEMLAVTQLPILKVTAYALQSENLGSLTDAADMWVQVASNPANPGA